MERETKIVKTPISKQEIVLKTYLIGKEKRALTSIFLKGGLSFNMETKGVQGLKSDMYEDAENLLLRTVIVSVDGHKDGEVVDGKPLNLLDVILDMRAEDYQFIVNEVNKISNDTEFEQKKTA